MEIILDPVEARVLGCLAEKELATPEYYPLSLNALTNACNQKSNRDPVMALEEAEIQAALDTLRKKQLALLSAEGVRTARFAHNLHGLLHLAPEEIALLTELLLRGPQTVGELRTRCERMRPFADLAAVTAALEELAERSPPLVAQLPRQPGRKESRFAQLLTPLPEEPVEGSGGTPQSGGSTRLDLLEQQVAELREELATLRAEMAAFRAEFE